MALGGIGEAMLFSAALGGGTAALTGGDPLKGALIGGLTGGVGAGISGLAAGQSMAQLLGTTAAETAGSGIASLTGSAAAPSAATNMLGGDPLAVSKFMETGAYSLPTGANATPISDFMSKGISQIPTAPGGTVSASQAAANLGVPGVPVSTLPGSQSAMLANQMSGFGPEGLESLRAATEGVSAIPQNVASAPTDAFKVGPVQTEKISFLKDPVGYITAKDNQLMVGSAALAGALGGQRKPQMPKRKEIEGLPIWAYRAKEGGIVALADGGMPGYDMVVGETPMYARGGISDLGTYSDGGRMLKGAGDGMSDSIPGVIAGKRPARLADGEFVVPADVVSHLGNGSTDAGAKQLYKMMDKVRAARTGTKKQGRQINPRRFMPA